MHADRLLPCVCPNPSIIMRFKCRYTRPIYTCERCGCNEIISLYNRHLNTTEHLIYEDVTDPDGYKHTEELPMCDVIRSAFLTGISNFERLFEESIPELNKITAAQVVSNKVQSKRKLYASAARTLQHKPISHKDAINKSFIKNERFVYSRDDNMKAPRMIQAASPRFNIELQRYITPIENYFFHRPMHKKFSTKGLNQYQCARLLRNRWDNYNDPVAILLDHTEFDSRQNTIYRKLECELYQQFYPNDDYLAQLLSYCDEFNYGTTSHGIQYEVKGSRPSGTVITSIGNSIINYCVITHWLQNICHIANSDIIVNGDDSVVIMERKFIDLLDYNALGLYGFDTKYSIAYDFEKIDYCQCRPVKTINGWLMVRSPQRVIERSTVCINKDYCSDIDKFRRWLHTVGYCEGTLNAGVPILQSFCQMLQRQHTHKIHIDSDITYRQIKTSLNYVITDEARLSFYSAYDITISRQLEIEHYFDCLMMPETIRHVIKPAYHDGLIQFELDDYLDKKPNKYTLPHEVSDIIKQQINNYRKLFSEYSLLL